MDFLATGLHRRRCHVNPVSVTRRHNGWSKQFTRKAYFTLFKKLAPPQAQRRQSWLARFKQRSGVLPILPGTARSVSKATLFTTNNSLRSTQDMPVNPKKFRDVIHVLTMFRRLAHCGQILRTTIEMLEESTMCSQNYPGMHQKTTSSVSRVDPLIKQIQVRYRFAPKGRLL